MPSSSMVLVLFGEISIRFNHKIKSLIFLLRGETFKIVNKLVKFFYGHSFEFWRGALRLKSLTFHDLAQLNRKLKIVQTIN